ncbi:MAG: hypothetical protein ACE5KQ_03775 [Thermoplasmata archaeon]
MRTTDLGIVALTVNSPRNSEALRAYVRAEFGERDQSWFNVHARRSVKKANTRRLFKRRRLGDPAIQPTG